MPTAGWDPAPRLGASVGSAGSRTGAGRRLPAISEPAVLQVPSAIPQGFPSSAPPSATQTGCKSAGAVARKGTVGAGREKPGSRMKCKMQNQHQAPER